MSPRQVLANGGTCADGGWSFASGLVAALEGSMVPASFFRQLLAEPVPDGLLRRLAETALRERLSCPGDLLCADEAAAEHYGEVLSYMRSICPSQWLVDLLELPARFEQFKAHVKGRHMGLATPAGAPEQEEQWERLWLGLEAGLPDYFVRAAERARAAVALAPGSPEVLDAAVDSVCLSALCEVSWRCGGHFVAEYWRRRDAVKGIEMLWRARRMGMGEEAIRFVVEGRCERALLEELWRASEEGWPSIISFALPGLDVEAGRKGQQGLAALRQFVRVADEWLMAYLRMARLVSCGPERVFGYLVGLDAELRNLALVAGGMARGVAPEVLEGRLRACYV